MNGRNRDCQTTSLLELIDWQRNFFNNDYASVKDVFISDKFLVRSIKHLIRVRPKHISLAVSYCDEKRGDDFFFNLLIKMCHKKIPALIFRLIKNGLIQVEKLYHLGVPNDLFSEFHEEELEYGFIRESIEYAIKSDDIERTREFYSKGILSGNENGKWSIYEWSKKPKSLSFLSLSAHFGSILCFKYLLCLGATVDQGVIQSVLFSYDKEILRIIPIENPVPTSIISQAIYENKSDISQDFLIEENGFIEPKLHHLSVLLDFPQYRIDKDHLIRVLVKLDRNGFRNAFYCLLGLFDKYFLPNLPFFHLLLMYSIIKMDLEILKYLTLHGGNINDDVIHVSIFLINVSNQQ